MTIKISQNINDNSIKYSNGLQSIDAIIGNIVSTINEPIKHKCKKSFQSYAGIFTRPHTFNFKFRTFYSTFNKFRFRITNLGIYKTSNPDFIKNKYTKFSPFTSDLY